MVVRQVAYVEAQCLRVGHPSGHRLHRCGLFLVGAIGAGHRFGPKVTYYATTTRCPNGERVQGAICMNEHAATHAGSPVQHQASLDGSGRAASGSPSSSGTRAGKRPARGHALEQPL